MKSRAFECLVLNASPCICLAKANLLHVPQLLAQRVALPEAVAVEILAGPTGDAAMVAIQQHYGERLEPGTIDQRVLLWALGTGETAVLSLCSEHTREFVAVLDDGLARRCARTLGLRCIGTIGLLIAAKRQGLIPSVTQATQSLANAGLYLDRATIREALRLAGEDNVEIR